MEIIITKGKTRNTLTCKRVDGSSTSENLGPDFPNHDIAHYVVEKKFNMKNGFYGNIKAGMSITQLSNKEVIKNLDSESWLAEIMTRNLQSISSGAATIEEYIDLVAWEVESYKKINLPNLVLNDVKEMKTEFDQLCEKWNLISENEQLSLTF